MNTLIKNPIDLDALERRDSWDRLRERITFTVSRRTLERALAEATIEAPWKTLLQRLGGGR
jgi:hypothetical protein